VALDIPRLGRDVSRLTAGPVDELAYFTDIFRFLEGTETIDGTSYVVEQDSTNQQGSSFGAGRELDSLPTGTYRVSTRPTWPRTSRRSE